MSPDEARRQRRLAVLVSLAIIAVVGLAGLWIVLERDQSRRAQNCLESGDRRCRLLQNPKRERQAAHDKAGSASGCIAADLA